MVFTHGMEFGLAGQKRRFRMNLGTFEVGGRNAELCVSSMGCLKMDCSRIHGSLHSALIDMEMLLFCIWSRT
jgi:hypothetical protein